MTPGEALAHSATPTIAAVLLVGGGLVGAMLKPAARAWAERWVLMPVGVLLALAALAYEVQRHNWIWAAIPTVVLGLLGLRLWALTRGTPAADAEKPDSETIGTGTKE